MTVICGINTYSLSASLKKGKCLSKYTTFFYHYYLKKSNLYVGCIVLHQKSTHNNNNNEIGYRKLSVKDDSEE